MSFDANGEYVITACEECGDSIVTCPHIPAGTLSRLKRSTARVLAEGCRHTYDENGYCEECGDDTGPRLCPECLGSGQVVKGWGRGKRTETCDGCDGQGALERDE